jgi:hypothetical protein
VPPAPTRARLLTFAIVGLALLAWWPLGSYWQSDDFLAVTYAHDPARALDDFHGNQYGTPAMVWFYRPLITLSFALDVWLGGGAPCVSHASNAIAHALSTWLVVRLGRRLLGDGAGWRLGLLWGLWPTHAGSVLWAVGRVDSHTAVWIFLSWWLTLRWLDRQAQEDTRQRVPLGGLIAFALALLSKELACIVPAGVALMAFALARGRRLAGAWRATWPFLVLFAIYLGWRYLVLGRLVGGYENAQLHVAASFTGLGRWLARVANPLLGASGVPQGVQVLAFFVWPLAVGLLLWRKQFTAPVLLGIGAFAFALPTAPFWAATAEIRSVRYFYVPAACLLAIVALAGAWPTVLLLLAAVLPFAQTRGHYQDAHAEAAALHQHLRRADRELAPGPLLVRGLPRENAPQDVILFHLFVDRLLLPPWGSGRRVLALRPLVPRQGVLVVPDHACAGLPGIHVAVVDATLVHEVTAPALPALRVEAEGDLHLSTRALWDLHLGRAPHALHVRDDAAPHYRLTLFTGGGYVATVLPNETPTQRDGRVALKSLLTSRYATQGDDAVVALALGVPATLDVATDFLLLLEAGAIRDGDPHTFTARARANRLLALRLDRDYAEWLAGRAGDTRRE